MLYMILGIITTAFAVVGAAVFAFGIRHMVRTVSVGRPVEPERKGPFGQRLTTTVIETLGHTRMLKWRWIGVAHWFIMVSFPLWCSPSPRRTERCGTRTSICRSSTTG